MSNNVEDNRARSAVPFVEFTDFACTDCRIVEFCGVFKELVCTQKLLGVTTEECLILQ